MSKLIFVCGPICSGKTTWCKLNIKNGIDSYIKVSDVVKELTNARSRADLQNTKHLETTIAEKLIQVISEKLKDSNSIYIDGVRQSNILKEILSFFKDIVEVEVKWLEVPYEERKFRYELRAESRDIDDPFEQAEKRDNELGLSELKQYIKEIISNP